MSKSQQGVEVRTYQILRMQDTLPEAQFMAYLCVVSHEKSSENCTDLKNDAKGVIYSRSVGGGADNGV